MLGQFFLARELSGATPRSTGSTADRGADRPPCARALGKRDLENQVSGLQTTLQSSLADRGRLQATIDAGTSADAKVGAASAALDAEKA
jgi:hypothetical protein